MGIEIFESWDKEQYRRAKVIFEKSYKDDKVRNIEELSSLIADIMIDHGPDGHCDGSEIMALILWRILKDDPEAVPECIDV